MTAEPVRPLKTWLAYAVHLYTASGGIFALLAMLEICRSQPDPQRVFIWLAIAVLIDATDGPLARRMEVKVNAPRIDGRTIDDIVDFLTFTFIPLVLIARMEWVPEPVLIFVAPAVVASLLGFANIGAKDERGGFFLGFPSYWNIVAIYAGIAASRQMHWVNGVALLLLALLTVTPVGFIYPNLAPPKWKKFILIGAFVWLAILLMMLRTFPHVSSTLLVISLIYPAAYTAISLFEYSKYNRKLP